MDDVQKFSSSKIKKNKWYERKHQHKVTANKHASHDAVGKNNYKSILQVKLLSLKRT